MDKQSKHLLSETGEERQKHFDDYRCLHPRLEKLVDQVMPIVRGPAGTNIVMVAGPTGVGKSTLIELLVKRITETALPTLAEHPGRLPLVNFKVPAPEREVKWNDFYIRYLSHLQNPLAPFIRSRQATVRQSVGPDEARTISGNNNLGALKRAVESALAHRKPMAVIIDEAQHLMRISSGRKLLDHLEVLKAMADMTNVLHILVGTYDLIANVDLNGQLSRRTTLLHFNRYDMANGEDTVDFCSTLNDFQNQLPLEKVSDLQQDRKQILAYSCGCVGILKNWMQRALARVLAQGRNKLDFNALKATKLPPKHCLSILSEINKGEDIFDSLNQGEASLFEQIGVKVSEPVQPPRLPALKKRDVGVRSPIRDPVNSLVEAA